MIDTTMIPVQHTSNYRLHIFQIPFFFPDDLKKGEHFFLFITMVTLLKRVCPYCDDSKSFQENRNTVKHVLSEHKKFLTPRPKAMQNEPGDKPLNQKNQELYPKAPVKLACPGCNKSFNDKTALKNHVDLLHIVFTERNQTSACPEDWIISGVNVSKRFQQFRDHCLRNGSDYLDIDRYFNQLL